MGRQRKKRQQRQRRKAPPSPTGRRATFEKVRASTVMFGHVTEKDGNETLTAVGSGFAVSGRRGLIVTAAHVLRPKGGAEPPTHVVVFGAPKQTPGAIDMDFKRIPLDASVCVAHPNPSFDLALVQVDHSFPENHTLRAERQETPYVGQWIASCGWPAIVNELVKTFVFTPTCLTGIVSSILPHPAAPAAAHAVYLTQLPVHPGNSGGPVVDLQTGGVVGVVAGRLRVQPQGTREVRVGLTKVTPAIHLSSVRQELRTQLESD